MGDEGSGSRRGAGETVLRREGGAVKVHRRGRTAWRFESEAGLTPCCVKIETSKNGERRVVAGGRVLHRGECVLRERSIAAAVAKDDGSLCAFCFTALQASKTTAVECEDCPTRYCSEECRKQDAADHDCAAATLLATLEDDETSSSIDVAVLRLVLRIWERKQLAWWCDHYEALRRDASRGDAAAEEVLKTAFMSTAILKEVLPEDADSERLMRAFLRVRFNAYPFANGKGLALFDQAASINHSCRPNVALGLAPDGRGHVLLEARFLGSSSVGSGIELTTSYLGYRALLAPTARRRDALNVAFRFTCACPRCQDHDHDHTVVDDLDALSETLLSKTTAIAKDKDGDLAGAIAKFDAVLEALPDLGAATYAGRSDLRILAAHAIGQSFAASPRRRSPDVLRATLEQASRAADDAEFALGERHPRSQYARDLAARITRLLDHHHHRV